MTEFKRTVQAVDEIEGLVQRVRDAGAAADVLRLAELVGATGGTIEKLHRRQTYGPQMREKIQALVSRWGTVSAVAGDVLQARGAAPIVPGPASMASAASPTGTAVAVSAPPAASHSAAPPAMPTSLAAPATASRDDRRALAARAAEARLQGVGQQQSSNFTVSKSVVSAPAGITTSPRPAAVSTATAEESQTQAASGIAAASMDVDQGSSAAASATAVAASAATAAPVPVVGMDVLMRVVHSVFLSHGFTEHVGAGAAGAGAGAGMDTGAAGPGPQQVRYVHTGRPTVTAMYLPVQRHLIVYAALEGAEKAPGRVTVQLGMVAESVQAKVDYLLVYPLVHRLCVPALPAIPPEVQFMMLCGLAMPGLAAVACASRGLAATVLEDEILWWRVLLALPASPELQGAMASVDEMRRKGEAVPAGLCRTMARDEVERVRREAEVRRKQREDMEARMRDPLLVQPPSRPGRPFFPGGMGFPGMGGPDDIMPGGGFLPPGPFGGGGRRPFGGGGGFGPGGGGIQF